MVPFEDIVQSLTNASHRSKAHGRSPVHPHAGSQDLRISASAAANAIPGSKLQVISGRMAFLAQAIALLTSFPALRRHEIEAAKRPGARQSPNAIQ